MIATDKSTPTIDSQRMGAKFALKLLRFKFHEASKSRAGKKISRIRSGEICTAGRKLS